MLVSDALRRIEIANNFGEGVHDPRAVLNLAGLFFFSMRGWRFTRRMTGYASSVAGVNYMGLPLGLTRLISIDLDDSNGVATSGHIQLVDPATFNRMRSTVSGADSENYVATEDWHADKNGTLTRRLSLSRNAVSSLPRGYRIAYEVGWQTIDGNCASSEVLPLPNYAEPLFGELLEAYALGLEEGSTSQRVGAVVVGPIAQAAFEADTRAVDDVGPIHNGWLSGISGRSNGGVEIIPVTINLTPP
jgi:hypothetical protein